jgi:hypothetical protein
MRRLSLLVTVAALAIAALQSPAEAAKGKGKARSGVFGTINGSSFVATNLLGSGDPCMFGTFEPSTNTLVFQALECKGKKRRRQGASVKKNYALVIVACQRANGQVPVLPPPVELVCLAGGYTENKTGRFGVPISTTMWGVQATFDPITFDLVTNLHVRIDAFDGTTISGVLYGVFDSAVSGPGSEVPAPISGEVQFSFPVQVR